MTGAMIADFASGLFVSTSVKGSGVDQVPEIGLVTRNFGTSAGGVDTIALYPSEEVVTELLRTPFDANDPRIPLAMAQAALVEQPLVDHLALWNMLKRSDPVLILDYTADKDQIALHYDPERIAAPEVSVCAHPGAPGTAEIRLNAHLVAFVANAPELCAEDIVLIADFPGHIACAAEWSGVPLGQVRL